MNYLQFDKTQLINLNYSLNKEILRTNRAGSFSLTTMVGCNTRKYHGLLACPIEHFNNEQHLLLSGIDESIIVDNQAFNLGIHMYENENINPQGHKYIRDLYIDETLGAIYRVGDVVLRKESIMSDGEAQTLLVYTLEESSQPITLQFRPFLAFRSIHSLSKANLYANTKAKAITNGMAFCLYEGYPALHLQFSVNNEYVHVPDWYYNIEYPLEKKRGYDYREDLLVPGYFEITMEAGDSIVLSAATKKQKTEGLKRKFTALKKKRVKRENFKDCLLNAAQQFIVKKGDTTELLAGYPWLGPRNRDTFIALSGLCSAFDTSSDCVKVLDTLVAQEENGFFKDSVLAENTQLLEADTSLWFFVALQELFKDTPGATVWKRYEKTIRSILNNYKNGSSPYIKMLDNGLIDAKQPGKALTWMSSLVQGVPVTPRYGCAVEVNALWYNAICYSLALAKEASNKAFIKEWGKLPEHIEESFTHHFWDAEKGYLADAFDGEERSWDIRPNMLIAAALPYSPVNQSIRSAVVQTTRQYLLTPRGIRSLSPENAAYKGLYKGSPEERDLAYHQGTAWPWLLSFYVRACKKLMGKQTKRIIEEIVRDMEDVVFEHGIGTIAEVYDGNPPFKSRGGVSQAWSVSAFLDIISIYDQIEDEE